MEWAEEYNVMQKRAILRIEDVLTYQSNKCPERVMQEWQNCHSLSYTTGFTDLLIKNQSIYVLSNWSAHIYSNIGRKLEFLENVIIGVETLKITANLLHQVYDASLLVDMFLHANLKILHCKRIRGLLKNSNKSKQWVDSVDKNVIHFKNTEELLPHEVALLPKMCLKKSLSRVKIPPFMINVFSVILHAYCCNKIVEDESNLENKAKFYLTIVCRAVRMMEYNSNDWRYVTPEKGLTIDAMERRKSDVRSNLLPFPFIDYEDVIHVKHIVKLLLYHPKSARGCIIRCSVRLDDDSIEEFAQILHNKIGEWFQVFPLNMFDAKHYTRKFYIVTTDNAVLQDARAKRVHSETMKENNLKQNNERYIGVQPASKVMSLKNLNNVKIKYKNIEVKPFYVFKRWSKQICNNNIVNNIFHFVCYMQQI